MLIESPHSPQSILSIPSVISGLGHLRVPCRSISNRTWGAGLQVGFDFESTVGCSGAMPFDLESDVGCRSANRFRLRIDRRGQVEYFDVVWLYCRSIFFLLPQLLKGFVVSNASSFSRRVSSSLFLRLSMFLLACEVLRSRTTSLISFEFIKKQRV